MKHTPDNIRDSKDIADNGVFVFGSNEAGIHGSGAANLARKKFGARLGFGFGHMGESFAIPTKDWFIQTLPLEVIDFYVRRFLAYASENRHLEFYVTKIGCGLAGYTEKDIGPLFKKVTKNVILPKEFCEYTQE